MINLYRLEWRLLYATRRTPWLWPAVSALLNFLWKRREKKKR